MSEPTRLLPSEFADLEPYAPRWSLATEPERWDRRHASTIGEMQELYAAMFPRVEAALAYCDRFPLDELPPDARNLLHLVFSFVMVSFPVEVWNDARIPDVGDAALHRVVSPAY
jgi:hypothetical protein